MNLSKLPHKKKKRIRITLLHVSTIGLLLSLILFFIIRFYSAIALFPIGGILRSLEGEYESVTDAYFATKNEHAYYDCTDFIEKRAREDLDMNMPTKAIYLRQSNSEIAMNNE
jgi:cell division protein FtsB